MCHKEECNQASNQSEIALRKTRRLLKNGYSEVYNHSVSELNKRKKA